MMTRVAGVVVVAVALGLRLWMPGPTIVTVDELNWTGRSSAFRAALAEGDLAEMVAAPEGTPATRPGVTTMWVGAGGEKLAERIGGAPLHRAHQLMGALCALLVAPFMAAARRLVGGRAALVAGGVVATEPLLVGHSAILHTDALLSMFVGVALSGLLVAVDARRAESDTAWSGAWWRRPSRRWAVVAGVGAAGALLTKITAAVLLAPAVVAVTVVHFVVRRRPPVAVGSAPCGRPSPAPVPPMRELVAVVAPFAAASLGVAVAAWPALWVAPVSALRATVDAAALAGDATPRLFLGDVGEGRDWRYYPVEAYYRTSPWLAVAGLVIAIEAVIRRLRGFRGTPAVARRHAAVLAFTTVAYLGVLGSSDKQYARYLLPLLPLGALFIGAAAARWWDRVGPGTGGAVAGCALGGATAFTALLAPYAISHVNPLVGGQEAAMGDIPLGWNEGKEQVGTVHRLPRPCPTWAGSPGWFNVQMAGCERVGYGWLTGGEAPPHMVLRYVSDIQRGREPAGLDAHLRRHGRLVFTVEIQGLDYVQVWHLDPSG